MSGYPPYNPNAEVPYVPQVGNQGFQQPGMNPDPGQDPYAGANPYPAGNPYSYGGNQYPGAPQPGAYQSTPFGGVAPGPGGPMPPYGSAPAPYYDGQNNPDSMSQAPV